MVQSLSYAGNIPVNIWLIILSLISLGFGYIGDISPFGFVGWMLLIFGIILSFIR
jgi:hypothetical protein